jgi:hypothetical protein
MKKLLMGLLALTFGLGVSTAVLADAKADEALAKACKGKKAGDEVTVDGKKMKCPAAKK